MNCIFNDKTWPNKLILSYSMVCVRQYITSYKRKVIFRYFYYLWSSFFIDIFCGILSWCLRQFWRMGMESKWFELQMPRWKKFRILEFQGPTGPLFSDWLAEGRLASLAVNLASLAVNLASLNQQGGDRRTHKLKPFTLLQLISIPGNRILYDWQIGLTCNNWQASSFIIWK